MLSNYNKIPVTPIKPHLIWAIISAAVAGFLFGVNTANIAGALPFIQKQFHTSVFQSELVVSITILFAFLSALSSAKLAKKYGYRVMLLVTALCFVMGSLLTGVSASFTGLLIGRSLLGIAIGVSSYAAPLYIAEIAPANYRGFFILLNGIAITGGETIAFWVDYVCGLHGFWRPMLWWSLFPALILLIGMGLMPNTPRWLIMRGDLSAARRALEKFHPKSAIETLMNTMKPGKDPKLQSLRTLFTNKNYRTPLIVGISLGIFQQFFGINTIFYYGPYIFAKAGFSLTGSAIQVTLVMGITNLLTTVITGLLIDKMGRRLMLLLGSGIACGSLLIIASLFHIGIMNKVQSVSMIVFMMMYIIGYCMSVGSLFWLIISEIFPFAIRDQGASLATGIQWFSNFIVSCTFLSMLEHCGASSTFLIYSAVCFFAMIFVYQWVPETRRLSLEMINDYTSSKIILEQV